jgi:hypothetical protein
MMKKLAQGGGGDHPLSTITYKVVVYAPAETAHALLLFLLYYSVCKTMFMVSKPEEKHIFISSIRITGM